MESTPSARTTREPRVTRFAGSFIGIRSFPTGFAAIGGALSLLLAIFGPSFSSAQEQDPFEPERAAENAAAILFVPLDGEITRDGTVELMRRIGWWLEREPAIRYVVLEIDSPGGDVEAAKDLADFLQSGIGEARAITLVRPRGLALSAAALVAMSTRDILMGVGSVIGAREARKDAPAIEAPDFSALSEVARDDLRQYLRNFARDRGSPTALADAIVEPVRADILRGTPIRWRDGQEVEDEYVFGTKEDVESLKRDQKIRIENIEVVLRTGERLLLSADDALEYRFASHIANDRGELKEMLQLSVPPQLTFDLSAGAERRDGSAQPFIDFLNHPFTRGVLILGGCLGLLLELKLLGTMIPGAIGLVCFLVFFIAASQPITGHVHGTASLGEIMLGLIGLGLVAVELIFPGFAIFAISGIALCGVSVVMAMVPGEATDVSTEDAIQSAISVFLFSLAAGLAVFFLLLRYLPKLKIGRRRPGILSEATIVGVPTADSAEEARSRADALVGRVGRAVTTLRPSGKIELDGGELVDVVTEGRFVESGSRVRIVEVTGARVVVTEEETSD